MWPAIAGIGSALANFAGGLFQNSAQQASADKQMDFQREQNATQYQRAMADMKAAGLNPLLAYSQGGNSSGAGAQANVTNPAESMTRGIESGANSARTLTQLRPQTENIAADTQLKRAQTVSAGAQADAALAQAKQTNLNSAITLASTQDQINRIKWDSGSAGNTYAAGRPTAKRGDLEWDYLHTPIGSSLATANIAGRDVAGATSALSSLGINNLVKGSFQRLGIFDRPSGFRY